jgi:hypothetical protein
MKYNYKYTGEFKTIDSEIKAYFLGFMYGDGCISIVGKRYNVRISIVIEDSYILDQFCKYFPIIKSPKSFDYSKYNKNQKIQRYINLASPPAVRDLLTHGLVTRKSCENKEKLTFPKMDKEFIHHFIRGFFDADGTICNVKKRPHMRYVDMGGVSKKFIYAVRKTLKKFNIDSFCRNKQNKGQRQLFYIIYFINSNQILKLIKFLYKDATIFLTRKKALFDSFRIVDKVAERNIHCPYCNSTKTTLNGYRHPSQRMYCENCKKRFSIRKLITNPPFEV